MKARPVKIVVHANVIGDYLTHRAAGPSLLRKIAANYFCYTTVVDASELFSHAAGPRQRLAVEHALSAMKILGINARSARRLGQLMREYAHQPLGNLLVAGLCLDSNLPLVTLTPGAFAGIRGLKVLDARTLAA